MGQVWFQAPVSECFQAFKSVLGGSWVVLSGVIGTHEPPSKGSQGSGRGWGGTLLSAAEDTSGYPNPRA